MDSSAAIASVRSFLALATEGQPPSLAQLSESLDNLALAYHRTSQGHPSDKAGDPPGSDYKAVYSTLSRRFPALGLYDTADPATVGKDGAFIGDAVDDLADIVGDLREVLWRFDNLGADDAHWHFRLLFAQHWGWHLRNLSAYLHVAQFKSATVRP